jgi:hypothetical protein
MITALRPLRSFMTQQKMSMSMITLVEYCHQIVAKYSTFPEEKLFDTVECFDFDALLDDRIDELHPKLVCNIYGINDTNVTPVKPNFESLWPLFGWEPAETIK